MDAFNAILDWFAGDFMEILLYMSRYLLPIFSIIIIKRCAVSMLREKYEPEVWGYIEMPDSKRIPIKSWECTIGRSSSSDIVVEDESVAKTQLVLNRDELGNWLVYDIGKTHCSNVNNVVVPSEGYPIQDGDCLCVGKDNLKFYNLTKKERGYISTRRTSPGKTYSPSGTFAYISIFIFLLFFQQFINASEETKSSIALAFAGYICIIWLYFVIMRAIGRRGFEVEGLAFFLCGIGLSVAASSVPTELLKQIILLLVGIIGFIFLGWWLRDLKRAKKLRWAAAILAVLMLGANVVFGVKHFGAKNWVEIAGFSFQPSEFVKIAYVYAGAATLDRLYRGRNLFLYIVFSALCVGTLALMGDFGTALVFFATFLVISFMRSGNIGTILLALTGAGLAGMLALTVKPYIANRFATWGHVWEDIYDAGFQQTQGMSAAASGGLFGCGAGGGWLENLGAADTDLVFCMVSEELGLIVALCAVAAILILAFFMVKNAANGRSSFYVIAGTASCSLLMLQMALNIFGPLDILPFTGVTFPFLSMGGSSLISCWCLLAFIKASDTRKNASFATKEPQKMKDQNEFTFDNSENKNNSSKNNPGMVNGYYDDYDNDFF